MNNYEKTSICKKCGRLKTWNYWYHPDPDLCNDCYYFEGLYYGFSSSEMKNTDTYKLQLKSVSSTLSKDEMIRELESICEENFWQISQVYGGTNGMGMTVCLIWATSGKPVEKKDFPKNISIKTEG